MSHTIYIQLNNKQLYIENCNDYLLKINKIKDRVEDLNLNINLNELIDKTNKLLSRINNQSGFSEIEYMNFLKDMSTLEKEVTNSFIFAKNHLKDSFLNNIIKNNEFNLIDKIQKHGILANEVISYLIQNNISVNNENFDKYVNEVENKKLNEAIIKKYIDESFDYIDSLKMNDELKFAIKKDIKNITQLNQLKDINAVIQTKETEYNNVLKLSKNVINKLSNQGFMIDKKSKMLWEIDDSNNIVLKMCLINDQNNLVQIIFNSN